MDTEITYDESKISINRISDYKKIIYDVKKVQDTLETYGLSKEEIEDSGLIKEVITKKNAKILSDFIKNIVKDDSFIDIYDYLDEKLVVRDH
jgi:hypothetical protein